jgi:anaerobic magnesium-protoporphyrin IX monomethyl ester cyclase
MRVLFINPPAKNFYSELGINLMPLGIGYLAAVLQKEGHDVSALDLETDPEKENDIDFENYDLVGISSDTPRFNSAIELGRRARRSGKPVVMGGYHTTFLDEEPIDKNAADFVLRGEAEYSMAELANKLEKNGNLDEIPGLTYQPNGKIIRTGAAPLIQDLDGLPFPLRSIFPTDKYHHTYDNRKMATMITSRGCPFDCYFCAASRFGGLKWRTRSLDSVLKEMEQLIDQGFSSFIFVDDNFTLNKQRIRDFCDEVIHRNWDIKWWCFSRADTVVKHPEIVEKMAEAGNREVFLGLESGNQETLDHYQKKLTLEQQKKAVDILKNNGVSVYGSFMMGEQHETEKMIKHTIKFAKKIKPNVCQFSILTPYPGSRMYNELKESDQLTTENWDYYDGGHLVFENANLDEKTLQKLLKKAYFRFYFRITKLPGAILGIFKDPKGLKVVFNKLKTGMKILSDLKKEKSKQRASCKPASYD